MSCPNWANVGCYTGAAVHDVSGNDVQVGGRSIFDAHVVPINNDLIFRNITKVVRRFPSLEAETLLLRNTNRPFQMRMVKIPSSPLQNHIVPVRSVTQNTSCPVMTHPQLKATCVKSVLLQ